mmetsp:Transcript_21882/g.32110  ORF Transcript_21882/g.32110 Transcript_21882/m.32110 type:complete len:204 (+) Transcript_21882:168-779(+)
MQRRRRRKSPGLKLRRLRPPTAPSRRSASRHRQRRRRTRKKRWIPRTLCFRTSRARCASRRQEKSTGRCSLLRTVRTAISTSATTRRRFRLITARTAASSWDPLRAVFSSATAKTANASSRASNIVHANASTAIRCSSPRLHRWWSPPRICVSAASASSTSAWHHSLKQSSFQCMTTSGARSTTSHPPMATFPSSPVTPRHRT